MFVCGWCGKQFEAGSSEKRRFCSRKCSARAASFLKKGVKRSEEVRKAISEKATGRDMRAVISRSIESRRLDPRYGRFETNQYAIDWHLESPQGTHYKIHNLANWLRENEELFGEDLSEKKRNNIASSLCAAKHTYLRGKGKGCWHGWKVHPTEEEWKKD